MTDPRELLAYDPFSGKFYWRKSRCGRAIAGREAGTLSKQGYRIIEIDTVQHKAHRLAFLFMTGAYPGGDVDHANLERADNRWCNLRLASARQNAQNRPRYSNNTSGLKGVSWHGQAKKWRAYVTMLNGKKKHIGLYATKEEAALAYDAAAELLYGEFALTNQKIAASKTPGDSHAH